MQQGQNSDFNNSGSPPFDQFSFGRNRTTSLSPLPADSFSAQDSGVFVQHDPTSPQRQVLLMFPVVDHVTDPRRPDSTNFITSIALDDLGSVLWAGFSNGQLKEFQINKDGQFRCMPTVNTRPGKRAIRGVFPMLGIKRLGLQFEDTDLELVDQYTHEDQVTVPRAKGIRSVAVDKLRGRPARIAVAMKLPREACRVLVYDIADPAQMVDSSNFIRIHEPGITVPYPSARDLAWVGPNLVLCTKTKYLLLDPSRNSNQLLLDFPEGNMYGITPVPQEQQAMLMLDNVGMLVDARGNVVGNTLALGKGRGGGGRFGEVAENVLAIGQAGYYIAVLHERGIRVFDRESGVLVQDSQFSTPIGQVLLNPREPDRKMLCVADNLLGNMIMVAAPKKIYCLCPVPSERQAQQLILQDNFVHGTQLILRQEDNASWVNDALAYVGLRLIQQMRVKQGVKLLSLCPTSALPPTHLFPLFPEYTDVWMTDIPTVHRWGDLTIQLTDMVTLQQDAQDRQLAKQRRLTSVSGELEAHQRFMQTEIFGTIEELKQRIGDTLEDDNPDSSQDAQNAIVHYLLGVRINVGYDLNDLGQIDTLIVLLLATVGDAVSLESFLSQENSVMISEVEQHLQYAGYYHSLALLYSSKSEVEQALQIWYKLYHNEIQDTSGFKIQQLSIHNSTKILKNGQKVEDVNLVREYLPWILQASPESGIQIVNARMDMNVNDTIQIVQKYSQSHLWQYYDHLVNVRKIKDPSLHTDFAQELIQQINRLNSENQDSSKLRQKLQQFLDVTDLYRAADILSHNGLVEGELWDEQVIIYRKLGNHEQALRVLALNKGDTDAAINYCKRIGGEKSVLFQTLFRMMLSPGGQRQADVWEALRVLQEGGVQLDPEEIVKQLTPDTPLASVFPLLAMVIRERVRRSYTLKIQNGLYRVRQLDTMLQSVALEQGYIEQDENTVCAICNVKLKTLFHMVVDKTGKRVLMCQSCALQQQQQQKQQQSRRQ